MIIRQYIKLFAITYRSNIAFIGFITKVTEILDISPFGFLLTRQRRAFYAVELSLSLNP
jgi:hypothetical protein